MAKGRFFLRSKAVKQTMNMFNFLFLTQRLAYTGNTSGRHSLTCVCAMWPLRSLISLRRIQQGRSPRPPALSAPGQPACT